jgi:Tol biopolymer transport system component/DNA-binding winged helix-turn-helix (wHTH) protein
MSQVDAQARTHPRFYNFGPFRLDSLNRLLLRDSEIVPLTSKVFDILLLFASNSGRLLSKEDLMEQVWPGSFVEEGNLTRNISTLRKALGESPREHQYIVTVSGRGYRFVATVAEVQDGDLVLQEVTRAESAIQETGHTDTPPRSFDVPNKTPILKPVAHSFPNSVTAFVTSGVAVIAFILFAVYVSRSRQPKRNSLLASLAAATEQKMLVTRVTNEGKASRPAVSADGKYVVYRMVDDSKQSLRVTQLATNSTVEIVPPGEIQYLGLITFSPDGSYVYYFAYEDSHPPPMKEITGSLYQVPFLGGTPKRLLENVPYNISLSPEGRRVAFLRKYPNGEMALITKSIFDGGGEQRLATRISPKSFWETSPAWSPDGNSIVCVNANSQMDSDKSLIDIRLADGMERVFSSETWAAVGDLKWFADGSGLILSGNSRWTDPVQLWTITYPAGEVKKITDDLGGYGVISATADATTLVTTKVNMIRHVWIVPDADVSHAQKIIAAEGTPGDYWGFSWTSDDRKIVYVSEASGHQEIWTMDADGGNRKQLTFDSAENFDPSVSPADRFIVFASKGAGRDGIWRIGIDGSNPLQLTHAKDFAPSISPDSQWVIYENDDSKRHTLWKVSIDGGKSVAVTQDGSKCPSISPDGKLIALWYQEGQSDTWKLALVPFAGGKPIKTFDVPSGAHTWAALRWKPDGRVVTYMKDHNSRLTNVWGQALTGGPPKQLTDFTSDSMGEFQWAHDGKKLVCARSTKTTDVVLIKNFR